MPAQRVIILRTGWPLPFSDYGLDTSFAVKYFSESLRQLMTWEFVPLLLSLYRLAPTLKRKTDQTEWIVIEEPEMGLHPKAISAVLLFLIQLLSQSYKVIISTHSAQVLDVVWAISEIKSLNAKPELFLEMFNPNLINVFQETATKIITHKQFQTYYFSLEKEGTYIKDISGLDLGSDRHEISSWGGLTEFSSQVAHVVAKAARQTLIKSMT